MSGGYRGHPPSGSDRSGRRKEGRQTQQPREDPYQEGQTQQPFFPPESGQGSRLAPFGQQEPPQHGREGLSAPIPPPLYPPIVPGDGGLSRASPGYYQTQNSPQQFGTNEDRRLPMPRGSVQHYAVQSAALGPQGPTRDRPGFSRQFEETTAHQYHHPSQYAPGQPPIYMQTPIAGVPRPRDSEDKTGMPGYPAAMPQREPKARFTAEDDVLIKLLKEDKKLSWKQISFFFPGRNSGTLQVRYCTKLKEKEDPMWTDEAVERLKQVRASEEAETWRRIAVKMGGNYSSLACQRKAEEIDELEEGLRREREEEARQAAAGEGEDVAEPGSADIKME